MEGEKDPLGFPLGSFYRCFDLLASLFSLQTSVDIRELGRMFCHFSHDSSFFAILPVLLGGYRSTSQYTCQGMVP